jgi:chromosome segregation ATPase
VGAEEGAHRMSDRTKVVLAVAFGAAGLLLGIFATIVAVNARDTANSGEAVTEQVRAEFAASQAAQDAREQASLSEAEEFVDSLSRQEKGLIRKLGKTDRRLKAVRAEVAALEVDQADEFDRVNRRVSKTDQQVARLKRQIANLREQVQILEAGG